VANGYGFFLDVDGTGLPEVLAGDSGALAAEGGVAPVGGLSGDFFTSNTFTRTAASLVKGEEG
jgi:hypothetical protein